MRGENTSGNKAWALREAKYRDTQIVPGGTLAEVRNLAFVLVPICEVAGILPSSA